MRPMTRARVRNAQKIKNTMRSATTKLCPGGYRSVCPNVLNSFKSFTDAVVPIETSRSVKVMTSPACGNVVVRDEPKCAKCSGMVSAFVA